MEKSKKILIGVAVDGRGGIDSYILSFVNIAKLHNFHCDILTTQYSERYYYKLKKYNANLIKISNLHNKSSIFKTIQDLHNKNNYCAAYWNISTTLMYPYLQAAKKCNIPINITHSHAANNDKENTIENIIFDLYHNTNKYKINKYTDYSLACSKNAASWLFGKKIANNGNFLFVPNPINGLDCRFNATIRTDYKKELDINDKYVIGCVTSFRAHKNPLFLVDVYREYLKHNKKSLLLVCADGPLKNKFINYAESKLPKDSYKLLGYRNDIPNILQVFDIFVYPSKVEGFGMSLVEAQASGLHCVFGKGIPNEASVVRENCHLIETYDAVEWANKIREVSKLQNVRDKNTYEIVEKSGFNIYSPKVIFEKIKF